MARLGKSLGIEVEIVESLKGSGFRLQARRWVVERTFARLVQRRRPTADYQANARTTLAWVHAAMSASWPGTWLKHNGPQTVP